ncbi:MULTISPECIES: FKBP-type peptidyl-prolyl cis-trans isomerase [unclassified Moraxella]|uniref:FKBP-type peptidyl-prolyl cis-trans isomerase n=1 Tax=unclassified Moraxella TaxID=2685852 RepID=UPI003AF58F45
MTKSPSLMIVATLAVASTATHAQTTTQANPTSQASKVTPSAYLPKTNVTANSADDAKVGYSLGYMMGEGNKETVDDLNLDAFFQGFRDAYQGNTATISKEQMQKTLLDYQKRKEAEYAKQIQAMATANLTKGKAFLTANAKQADVKTTASGLQYQVLKQGTGKRPTAKDQVKVHYEGRLIDGTIFDSSYKRDKPVTFPLNQVIKGWSEGVQLMSEGAKYRLFMPAELGYGEAGNADIEPNSVLIFDVELLEVNPKATVKK